MGIATGTVVAGKVVVEGLDLPEGSTVTVLTPEPDEEVRLSAEEEAELLDAIAEVERGETVSSEELLRRLDRIAKLGRCGCESRPEPPPRSSAPMLGGVRTGPLLLARFAKTSRPRSSCCSGNPE